MNEEKLNALSQVPILRDERFNIGYIAKWCGEDVASDEINCNQDHDQLMKNGHSDCWTCGEVFQPKQKAMCSVCDDVRKQLRGLPESKLHGDNGLAAATMRGFNRLSENEDKWQAKYKRLNLSLAKNKRLFSDEHSQSVIESQVKRIKRLEDDLSRANCELDKLRKQNAWRGVDTESFVGGVRTGELDLQNKQKRESL